MALMENTTMKKSFIIVALAILMVMPVFATDPTPVTTPVELELKLTPVYSMGITTREYTESVYDALSDKTKILDADIVKDKSSSTPLIALIYSTTDYTLTSRTDLFVTYIFTEYNICTLSMKIDKPLTCTTKAEGASDYDKINYQATVNVGTTTSADNKTVEDNDTDVELKKYTAAATKIAEAVYDSFELTIGPKSTDTDLKGKYIGVYKSNIILTLTEDS